MEYALGTLAFAMSALCAGIMGFAIQRGATCTVAAVDELVTSRRCTRIGAMLEASLWVVAGLLIAQALGVQGAMPGGYPVGAATIAGGALLGFGAYVNRACVFGAIARLGSGEWSYAVTPLGFYVGCVIAQRLPASAAPPVLSENAPLFAGPGWIAASIVALLLLRAAQAVLARKDRVDTSRGSLPVGVARDWWSPRAATCVIGITFVVILLLSGAWAYTDVLAQLAHGMAASLPARIGLLLALFAGAVVGGLAAGRFRSGRITAWQLARCFAGGLLMGLGSLLIPGSNDGLVLVGMPLLWPYAWTAFLTMCAVIAAAIVAARFAATIVRRDPRRA